MSVDEKARNFDKSRELRRKINESFELLKHFREIYPFKDDPGSIDKLTPDDLFKKREDCFFNWLEFKLRPLGRIALGSGRNAHDRLEEFKDLLRIVVDEETSLAEKVDAPWEKIGGMGGDKHVAKKIISCYDDSVLPVFKTDDLEYFFNLFMDKTNLPSNYNTMTLGEKYQYLTRALIDVKESNSETREWDNSYFMRFLYEMYPPTKCVFIDMCKIQARKTQACKNCPLSWLKRKYRHRT